MTPASAPRRATWLTSPWFLALLCMAGAVPLLYPAIPPLTDLPGHIGRYAVQIGMASAPELRRWYSFDWTLIPNLGIDLLVQIFAPHLRLERTVKLIVMAIVPLQMAGYLLVARQVHGHVPPTALFALPLAWCYSLHFGFINFGFAIACATWAFALWIAMARGDTLLRTILFIPIACLLWVGHLYGWAVLCIMAFCHEIMRRRATGARWRMAAFRTMLTCAPLITPQILKLILPLPATGVGKTLGFLNFSKKLGWLLMMLRDRWMFWDIASVVLLFALILWGLRSRRFTCDPALALITAVLALLFLAIPTQTIGSYYSDMRLAPTVVAFALLMLRPTAAASPRLVRRIALAGTLFVIARLIGTTASLYLYDRDYARELGAIDHIPRGAALVTLVQSPCSDDQGWKWDRRMHLGGLALARRHSFSNDQWYVPGGQLLTVHFPQALGFEEDPSQRTTWTRCDADALTVREAIDNIPAVFDYLWMIAPTKLQSPAGWRMLWTNGTSGVYVRSSRLGTNGPR